MKVKYIHVCADCGVSHCGCPHKDEGKYPGHYPDGSYTLEGILVKQSDDNSCIRGSSCTDRMKPWASVIGCFEEE